MGQMECYERDFEEAMLKDTAEYYRRRAAVWIQVWCWWCFVCVSVCGGGYDAAGRFWVTVVGV
jgi:hypothetical protein